jgi:hypothetical protein
LFSRAALDRRHAEADRRRPSQVGHLSNELRPDPMGAIAREASQAAGPRRGRVPPLAALSCIDWLTNNPRSAEDDQGTHQLQANAQAKEAA